MPRKQIPVRDPDAVEELDFSDSQTHRGRHGDEPSRHPRSIRGEELAKLITPRDGRSSFGRLADS